MQYKSTHELVHFYKEALNLLKINTETASFLNLDRYNPKEDEQKIMRLLIEIADILELDLMHVDWFHIKNEAQPFNALSPYEYILKGRQKGLLETLFYVKALAVSSSIWPSQMKGEALAKEILLQVEVPPLPRPTNFPDDTD